MMRRGMFLVRIEVVALTLMMLLLVNQITARQNSSGEGDNIYLEMEAGEVEPPMLIASDEYALGNQYIQVEGDNKSSSNVPSSGKVTVQVTVSGGEYTIWGRTIAQTESSDSFWVQVNDGPAYNWNGIRITPFWGWSQVHDFTDNNQVVTWILSEGTHEISIYYREPGTRLDALFITNTATIPTEGDELYPPNLTSIENPPVPWKEAYNFTLPNFKFEHPMTVISGDELEMVKHYVEQEVEPQYSAYLELINDAEDAQSFVPDAPSSMNIMGGYEPNSNLNEVREQLWRNCHAAYSSALAYQFTGEAKYADKAIEVMMDWANANTTFTGGDRGLQLGSWFSQVLYAADLIHDYEGWTDSQRATFKSWWRNNVLVHPLDVLRGKDNNWKDAGLLGVFTASVVLEDTLLLKEALIQLKSYFYERVDESVRNPGVDWKMRKDEHGVYLPREVVRNNGSSGLTYTAYALTTMVQCLDMAKYAGFDLWHDSTSQGADLVQLIETYYQWDILDQTFPWHPSPNKSDKRRNAYELANINLDLPEEIVAWIENNRPQVAREGDEYATLTKGDIHISKLITDINLTDNQSFAPGDTIPIVINITDPFEVGLDQVQILLNDIIQSTHSDLNIDTYIIMPSSNTEKAKVDIRIVDQFGVVDDRNLSVLNADQAKLLEITYDSTFGTVAVEPDQPSYVPGQEVTITATSKFPYEFKAWSGDNSSTSAELTIIIEDDYSLEAAFEQLEDPRLNFNFQPRDDLVVPGYRRDVGDPYALSNGIISGWRITEPINGIRRSSNDVVDPRKLTYIAMQLGTGSGDTWELEVAAGNYNIELGFGDYGNPDHLNTFLLEDSLVTDPDGKDSFDVYRFSNFQIDDGHLTILPTGENVKISYLKIAPANTELTTYLAVDGGTGAGEYEPGTQVAISAPAPTGNDLFEWQGDTTFVDDFTNNETFVIIPDQDVQLIATYLPTYALNVENGSGAGNYKEGEVVAIEAGVIEGQQFTGWSGDTQFLADAALPNTTVEMSDQVISLKAEYEQVVLGLDLSSTSFKIYPNPTNNHAVLEFELIAPSPLSIELLDLSGKHLMHQTDFFSAGFHQVIIEEQLILGINVLRVSTPDHMITQLIVKR
ncbi:MAG: alginate lyase family protein [Cyclobacteriaceae bacterium]